jgi:eukaryotic-like serine/threonine-protein kinase
MSFIGDRALDHLRNVVDLPDLTGTRYRLGARIGSGGMGVVYLVEDRELGREAAMKILAVPEDPEGELSRRLLAEARLVAALEHPNIVPVHDAGVLPDGRVFYVMKLVRGMRLDEWRLEAAPRPALLRLFQKVCEAVAFAHARGIIHRDLKPENVMIGAFGEALVMDWGIAKILRGTPDPAGAPSPGPPAPAGVSGSGTLSLPGKPVEATRRGALIGTPAYMAPEQAAGETDRIDERTDVYALGALLFFLLSGRPPYEGTSAAAILSSVREGPAPALRSLDPAVPKALDAICRKAMSLDSRDRYASAREMAMDVQRLLDGQPVSAYRETLLDGVARFLRRNRAFVLLLLAYLLMRILVLVFLL